MTYADTYYQPQRFNHSLLVMLIAALAIHGFVIANLQWTKPQPQIRKPNPVSVQLTLTKTHTAESTIPAVKDYPQSQSDKASQSTQAANISQDHTKQSQPAPQPSEHMISQHSSAPIQSNRQPQSQSEKVAIAELIGSISDEYQQINKSTYHSFDAPKHEVNLNFDSKLFDLKLPQRLKEGSVETYTDINGQPAYKMVVNGQPLCVHKHEFSFYDSFTPNVWVARSC